MADSSVISASARQGEQGGGRQLFFCNAVLLVLVLGSAFAAIYSTHACRALYTKLQALESSQWYLHEDYGRLVLEQSTWASHYRVEKVARGDLGMTAPDLAQYKVVPQ
ncbi:MAG: cell division protein FtsL [Halioglobus sp.]|nr:cell division protein FtsL [Halioglobus sp.]